MISKAKIKYIKSLDQKNTVIMSRYLLPKGLKLLVICLPNMTLRYLFILKRGTLHVLPNNMMTAKIHSYRRRTEEVEFLTASARSIGSISANTNRTANDICKGNHTCTRRSTGPRKSWYNHTHRRLVWHNSNRMQQGYG